MKINPQNREKKKKKQSLNLSLATSPMAGEVPGEASHWLPPLFPRWIQCCCLLAHQCSAELSCWLAVGSSSSRASPPVSQGSGLIAFPLGSSCSPEDLFGRLEIPMQLQGSPIQTEQMLMKQGSCGILCSFGVAGSLMAGGSLAAMGLIRLFLFPLHWQSPNQPKLFLYKRENYCSINRSLQVPLKSMCKFL